MRRAFLPVILTAAVASLVASATAGAQRPSDLVNRQVTARVVAVIDGDTVDVLVAPDRHVRVRLHGIDAPESGEPFSQQARVFTRVFMFARDVLVTGKDIDTYGRLVARITVEGADASAAIVAAGLACTFRRYASDPAIDAAFRRAKADRVGFWAPGAPQPPCVAREALAASAPARTAAAVATGVIGNTSSHVYHLPTCHNATCKNCTRRFGTRQDAEAAGFRPAGDCIRR